MQRARIASCVPALLTFATLAAAQEPSSSPVASVLTTGSRIRVLSTAFPSRLQGAVVEVDDKQVTLNPDGGSPLKVPLQSVMRMEVSLGRRRNALKGMLIGALSFGALGLTAPVDPNDCGEGTDNLCSHGEGLAAGALVGAGLGARIGALIKSERWGPIAIGTPASRIGRRGTRAHLGVALAIRF